MIAAPDPMNATALMESGIASIKLDINDDSRRADLQKAIQLNDKLVLAYSWLSLDTDDAQQALDLANTAVGLDPNSCEAHAALAYALGKCGKFANGASEGTLAHKLAPDNTLGMTIAALTGAAAKEQLCRTAIRSDPQFLLPYMVLCSILQKSSSAQIAFYATAATQISPHSALAAMTRYYAAMATDRFDDARLAAESAVLQRPFSPIFQLSAASADYSCHHFLDAKIHIDRVFALEPTLPGAARLRAKIDAAMIAPSRRP
jgi:tetratricopeptide (TPR) repeat protein